MPGGEPDEQPLVATQPPAFKTSSIPEPTAHPWALTRAEPSKRPLDQAALDGLAKAVRNSASHDDNYANLADVGHYLGKISPDLNARNYGYVRLREFVEASGIVNLKWKDMGDKPPVALVCLQADLENISNQPY